MCNSYDGDRKWIADEQGAMRMNGRSVRQKGMVLGILLLGGIALYLAKPQAVRQVIGLLAGGDLPAMVEYIRSFGSYAALISFFIVVLINCAAILPNIFMLAANGIIFGIWEGTLISWAAESVGVIISFLYMRYFLRDSAHALIARSNALQQLEEVSGKNGLAWMIVARAIPFIPSGLITALGAISAIRVRDYVIATFIGKLPSAWIEVTIGHDLASYREHGGRLALLLAGSAAAYAAYWRRRKNRQ